MLLFTVGKGVLYYTAPIKDVETYTIEYPAQLSTAVTLVLVHRMTWRVSRCIFNDLMGGGRKNGSVAQYAVKAFQYS